MSHVYLITGANRGLGLGMVRHYLTLPNNIVIAGVRDTTSVKDLSAIISAPSSMLIFAKIDAFSETDAATAVTELKCRGIAHIDTVIANAGLGNFWGSALDTTPSHMLEHFQVNAMGPLILFQAVWPLLEAAKSPKFVTLGTPVASMSELEYYPLPSMAYATSKAATHFVTRKLHFEFPALTVFTISPGWVQTPMGNAAAGAVGMNVAPLTQEQSVAGLVMEIDGATREKSSGTFASYDGAIHAW